MLLTLTAGAQSELDLNQPFGFCTVSSRTTNTAYNITGGGCYTYPVPDELSSKTTVLQSNGLDMRTEIANAIRDYDIIILDGSKGDFIVSKSIDFADGNKTIIGINNARLCTQWYVTDEIKAALNAAGVPQMSTSTIGGQIGGKDIEEAEYNTRTIIRNITGDNSENYRNAGIFGLNKENVIIRNITFVGPGSVDVGGKDLISATGAKHCWIDHCTFQDGEDGNFDITNSSDFITVSWCIFRYTDRSYMHQNTNLVGSSDSEATGYLNTTYAFNWWGSGCVQRMPMGRVGKIHMLNNYFTCAGSSNCINPRKNSEFLIEGNYFGQGVKNYYSQKDATAVTWATSNHAEETNGLGTPSSFGSEVKVPYTYTPAPYTDVPTEVKANAGAKLKYGDITEPTVNGFITWPFNTGANNQTATLTGEAANGIESTSVTLGSHLQYVGKKTSDIAMTGFTITDQTSDSEAKAENAVNFNFTIKKGYTFTPMNVSFCATRFGTDNGHFSSYLRYSDNSKITICGKTLAYRDNGKTSNSDATATPKHSTIDFPIDDAQAMTGSNSLVIHLFSIPYNATSAKSMGLANIAISGMLTSTTGISTPVSFSPALSTEYYNMAGQRVTADTRGLVIVRQRMADGTVTSKKVIR